MAVVQVFESHTQLDKATCDKFSIAASLVGIKVFRSEFERIEPPAWKTIKQEMERSAVLFLLVGPELVRAQATSAEDWKYTQNWIAYEVGLACALGKDAWVLCDGVDINFPVPYLNNYSIGLLEMDKYQFERGVLKNYLNGMTYPLDIWGRKVSCPNCKAEFNFHTRMSKGSYLICPTCLRPMAFNVNWLYENP
jgi:hypothetical protein